MALVEAIKASTIHKNVGLYVRDNVKPDMTLKDIVLLIENKIKEEIKYDEKNKLEKGIGFPVGVSLNNCAAHYTPNYHEKDIILTKKDIIKIDYGVHYRGTIIDSAFTLHFDSKYDEFINISRDLTNFAVKQCGPDAILGEIGKEIEDYIKNTEVEIDGKVYPLNIMSELSGHKIARYEIHAGKAVPNIGIYYPLRMNENEFYAIEPFITTGNGKSILKEPNSHYMIPTNQSIYSKKMTKEEENILNMIRLNYSTLPFCQKWLYELNNTIDYDSFLHKLVQKNVINVYPPIYDIQNSIISQFEHTIYIKENGIINLTKNDFY
jgi:methionyl aminopeptidase